VTLSTFATDESASVQATIYNTAEEFLKQAPAVKESESTAAI
jgi:urate oxidase